MKRSRAEADLLDDNFDIKRRRNNLFGNNTNVLMEDALEISGDGKVEDFIRTFNDVRVQSLKKQVKMLMKINGLLLKKLADKETIIKSLEQNNNPETSDLGIVRPVFRGFTRALVARICDSNWWILGSKSSSLKSPSGRISRLFSSVLEGLT